MKSEKLANSNKKRIAKNRKYLIFTSSTVEILFQIFFFQIITLIRVWSEFL